MKSFFTDFLPEKTLIPETPDEVQEILRKANRDQTPLVPVSSGTNLQDTHLPSVKNAISLDLSQLNRILYLDAKNRNAVIEPGVSFTQLQQACKKKGLRVLTAIDVPKDGSVLGSYLEMMPLYGWPKYHPWEMLTMQGFRGDAEFFATGQMAMKQKRMDKYSWGVSFAQVARLFCQAQGTLGVITSAAVTLKTATPFNCVYFFPSKSITHAIKALKAFMATEEPHEIFACNKIYLADLLGLESTSEIPRWTVVLVIRGFEKEELSYKRKDLKKVALQLGGKLITKIQSSQQCGEKLLAEINYPAGHSLHYCKGKGWVPIVSIATAKQIKDCSILFPKSSGVLLMPLQAGGCFYYQPDIRYENERMEKARKIYMEICTKLIKAGVIFPRPSSLIAKTIASANHEYTQLLRSIKNAIDPKNIMNPGKLGL